MSLKLSEGEMATKVALLDKCLQLAARDYERRWGCAPNYPYAECYLHISDERYSKSRHHAG
jgi:hypothetical protein